MLASWVAGEEAGDLLSLGAVEMQILRAVQDVGIGDLLVRATDGDLNAVIAHQVLELLGQVILEKSWARQSDGVVAGRTDQGEGAADAGNRPGRRITDAQFRIGVGAAPPKGGIGTLSGLEKGGEVAPQVGDGLVVKRLQILDDRGELVWLGHGAA